MCRRRIARRHHGRARPARDALFLARLPPSRLAWVYLAIAVVSLGLFVLQERRHARGGRAALAAWLAGSAVVDVLLWALIAQPATWTLYVLYTWSGVFASLVVVRFWTLLGDLFSISQAKRVFALIGAGGAGGVIVGSLLARALTDYLQPRHFLLPSALVLVATAAATRFLLPRRESTPAAERRVASVDLRWPLQAVWLRPYLRRVAGTVLLSAVTLTLVDFLFKSAVATAVPPDELGSFFATTYLVLNAVADTPVTAFRYQTDAFLDTIEQHFEMALEFLATMATGLIARRAEMRKETGRAAPDRAR